MQHDLPKQPARSEGTLDSRVTGEQVLRGEVLRVVFASDDGGYAVIRLLDQHKREHTIVGPLASVLEGQDIEASGHWERHREHGRQFRVHSFRAVLPTSPEGIRRYLASGVIPGIGPKLAQRVVDHFGADTLNVLDKASGRLKEIPGLGRKRIPQIRRAWKEHEQQRDLYIFLQGLGIGPAHCAALYRRYGTAAAEIVRKNPYQLASEVRGIGFLTADRIAARVGIASDNPLRLAAGIGYTLERLSEDGHVCYPRQELLQAAARLLQVDTAQAENGLKRALANGSVVTSSSNADAVSLIYQRMMFAAESGVAGAIARLVRAEPAERVAPQTARFSKLALNDEQEQAITQAFLSCFSIITGGPGVGKTTVVGEIVRTARRRAMVTVLAAPTGRAAKRLSEASGMGAKTIHRLLKWNPSQRSFVHNRDKPLRCDLLIVDEVSMLDINLAFSLFSAVRAGTHVVLVGDRDQLPSVGPGAVLHDLIACGCVPVTHLSEIFRQDEQGRIVRNAHSVNRGEMPDLHAIPRGRLGDFYWIDQEDPERVVELITTLARERVPRRFGFDPRTDVQVLAPMNRGTCGTIALNDVLQQTLNPGPKPQFSSGDRKFRAGDRVMQISNNYDKGVFNGDLGLIVTMNPQAKTFDVAFDTGIVSYELYEADQIRLAYAVTVHKSQGSEFPVVIIPLLTQHYVMLQRNLVYTGMTRARRLLIMIGTRKALAIAVRNNRPMQRCTRLVPRLRQELSRGTGSRHSVSDSNSA